MQACARKLSHAGERKRERERERDVDSKREGPNGRERKEKRR